MKYNHAIVKAFFRSCRVPEPQLEYRFHPERKWRFDFSWPPSKVALEVQGGIFIYGGHNRGASLLKEYEKLNEAAAMGWRVCFVTPQQLCSISTTDLIKRALCL